LFFCSCTRAEEFAEKWEVQPAWVAKFNGRILVALALTFMRMGWELGSGGKKLIFMGLYYFYSAME